MSARPYRETSNLSLRLIDSSGERAKRQAEVLGAIRQMGPLTGNEVNSKVGSKSAHKRLSELCDAGLIAPSGKRRCRITGRECIEWRAIDPGEAATRTKKQSLKELILENVELKARIAFLEGRVFDSNKLYELALEIGAKS